ncbi:unnamed protein product, partial [Mesorhabditis spiculigera]
MGPTVGDAGVLGGIPSKDWHIANSPDGSNEIKPDGVEMGDNVLSGAVRSARMGPPDYTFTQPTPELIEPQSITDAHAILSTASPDMELGKFLAQRNKQIKQFVHREKVKEQKQKTPKVQLDPTRGLQHLNPDEQPGSATHLQFMGAETSVEPVMPPVKPKRVRKTNPKTKAANIENGPVLPPAHTMLSGSNGSTEPNSPISASMGNSPSKLYANNGQHEAANGNQQRERPSAPTPAHPQNVQVVVCPSQQRSSPKNAKQTAPLPRHHIAHHQLPPSPQHQQQQQQHMQQHGYQNSQSFHQSIAQQHQAYPHQQYHERQYQQNMSGYNPNLQGQAVENPYLPQPQQQNVQFHRQPSEPQPAQEPQPVQELTREQQRQQDLENYHHHLQQLEQQRAMEQRQRQQQQQQQHQQQQQQQHNQFHQAHQPFAQHQNGHQPVHHAHPNNGHSQEPRHPDHIHYRINRSPPRNQNFEQSSHPENYPKELEQMLLGEDGLFGESNQSQRHRPSAPVPPSPKEGRRFRFDSGSSSQDSIAEIVELLEKDTMGDEFDKLGGIEPFFFNMPEDDQKMQDYLCPPPGQKPKQTHKEKTAAVLAKYAEILKEDDFDELDISINNIASLPGSQIKPAAKKEAAKKGKEKPSNCPPKPVNGDDTDLTDMDDDDPFSLNLDSDSKTKAFFEMVDGTDFTGLLDIPDEDLEAGTNSANDEILPDDSLGDFNIATDISDLDDQFLNLFDDDEADPKEQKKPVVVETPVLEKTLDPDSDLDELSDDDIDDDDDFPDHSAEILIKLGFPDFADMTEEQFLEYSDKMVGELRNNPSKGQLPIAAYQQAQMAAHQQQLMHNAQRNAAGVQGGLSNEPNLRRLLEQPITDPKSVQQQIFHTAQGQIVQVIHMDAATYAAAQRMPLDNHSRYMLEQHRIKWKERRLEKKTHFLKRSVKVLVYKNGALSDEVGRLGHRIVVVTTERRDLAKRLQHLEKNYLRRLTTAKKKKEIARAQKNLIPFAPEGQREQYIESARLAQLEARSATEAAKKVRRDLTAMATTMIPVLRAEIEADERDARAGDHLKHPRPPRIYKPRPNRKQQPRKKKKRSKDGVDQKLSEEYISQEVSALLSGIKADQEIREQGRLAQAQAARQAHAVVHRIVHADPQQKMPMPSPNENPMTYTQPNTVNPQTGSNTFQGPYTPFAQGAFEGAPMVEEIIQPTFQGGYRQIQIQAQQNNQQNFVQTTFVQENFQQIQHHAQMAPRKKRAPKQPAARPEPKVSPQKEDIPYKQLAQQMLQQFGTHPKTETKMGAGEAEPQRTIINYKMLGEVKTPTKQAEPPIIKLTPVSEPAAAIPSLKVEVEDDDLPEMKPKISPKSSKKEQQSANSAKNSLRPTLTPEKQRLSREERAKARRSAEEDVKRANLPSPPPKASPTKKSEPATDFANITPEIPKEAEQRSLRKRRIPLTPENLETPVKRRGRTRGTSIGSVASNEPELMFLDDESNSNMDIKSESSRSFRSTPAPATPDLLEEKVKKRRGRPPRRAMDDEKSATPVPVAQPEPVAEPPKESGRSLRLRERKIEPAVVPPPRATRPERAAKRKS